MNKNQKHDTQQDSKPLDPSGISDHLHELKKQGLPTTMAETLLAYETDHRLC